MKFKFIKAAFATVALTAILGIVGCEFDTYVKTDEVPESSVSGFFDSLKAKDFASCNQYLANANSFEITNSTGFDFADMLLEAQIESLDYEFVGDIDISGDKASCKVNVTSLDISAVSEAMTSEYPKVRSQYMIDNEMEDFSTDDTEALNEIVTNTFNEIIADIGSTQKEITVNLEFQNGMWKIVVDDELCAAIFGGDSE